MKKQEDILIIPCPPYVVTTASRKDIDISYFDESEKEDLSLMQIAITEILAQYDFLRKNESKFVLNPENNTMGWKWVVSLGSFRDLLVQGERDPLLAPFVNDVDGCLRIILDLHFRLLCSMSHTTLIKVMNRIMNAIESIPVQDTDMSFADLHVKYPYLWLIIQMQVTLRNITTTLVV